MPDYTYSYVNQNTAKNREDENMSEENTNNGQRAQVPNAPGGGQQLAQEPRTFTQEQLDAILRDRLERERTKYADYDALKEAKSELDKIREEQMSELEKAQKRATELQAERDRALEQAQETLIRSAFISEAAQAGVAHPEDAYMLADLDGVKVDEDGTVGGVAETVKALVEAGRLVMASRPQAPSLDAGAGSGKRAGEKPAALTPEELEQARKMRLTPEQYAAGKTK